MPPILVEGLGKQFRQYHDRGSFLARVTGRRGGRDVQDIWALRDLDFTVARGETVGIIGRNGSGKTTLLRLLSGVSAPSEGHLRIEGRIASLIGIGVGFNRELTGRENVLVNGRLLGMTTEEIAEKFDRIVEFAELQEFIDLPVKFYSSGMFLRLAFSVAIHVDPDVLLVDEILAVGDIAFQSKCFERMRRLQESGTTVVVVTHNLQVLQRLTRRTLVLERGRIRFDGDTEEAIAVYHESLQSQAGGHVSSTSDDDAVYENSATVRVTIEDETGRPTAQVRSRAPMAVRVDVTFREVVEDPIVAILLDRPGVGRLFATASAPRGDGHTHGPDRPMTVRLRLGDVPLLPATYSVHAEVRSSRVGTVYGLQPATLFAVTGPDRQGAGSVDVLPELEIDGEPAELMQPRLGTTTP